MKRTGWIVAVIVALGAGYVIRGLLPPGKAPAGGDGRGAMPPPTVKFMETRREKAAPVTEYIAHVLPIQQVHLIAQLDGTIQEVHFREGSRVKQDDLLFTIDPAPYETTLAERQAELEQARAELGRAEKYLAMLTAADNRSVSQSGLDKAEADVADGQAMLNKAKAAVRQAEIDLGYTKIHSPIEGRIGRALITRGNLVTPSSGPLATVIQVDPIRVVFSMPDTEYLTAFDRYSSDGSYNPEVTVRLANDKLLPDEGKIDFDDNQMNPATGTIDIFMLFPNPKRLLVPNNFVTARVRDASAPMKILVPAEAVMHDADGAFVWTLSDDHTVAPARVETGAVIDTRQVIESGLDEGIRIVVAGVQNLRPGMTVSPAESKQPRNPQ